MDTNVPRGDSPTDPPSADSRASAVDTCARALREAIVRGELPAGARLLPERALAERFGVNRVTVRGAIAQLEAEHLVSVRHGSGCTVRDYRRTAGLDLVETLASLARSPSERRALVRDLLHVRRQLARAVLERLADEPDRAALDAVEAAVERLEAVAGDAGASLDELMRADLDVAAAFVAASRSTVLALCLNPVASLLGRLPDLARAMYRAPSANVAAWRTLLAWGRRGERAGIDALMDGLAARDAATVDALLGAPEPGRPSPRAVARRRARSAPARRRP
jgi:DNA-binding FadR family transcriptional regulator